MEIINKTETDCRDGKDGKKRIYVSYPHVEDDGVFAGRVNGFISEVVEGYKSAVTDKPGCVYGRLTCDVRNADPFSVFFGIESYFSDGSYTYRPASAAFSADGYAASFRPDKKLSKKIKRFYAEKGIKACGKDIRYSYYISNGRTVVYRTSNSAGRGKRSLVEYIISRP